MQKMRSSWRSAGRGLLFCAVAAACWPTVSCVKNGPEKTATEVRPTVETAEAEKLDVAYLLERRARSERLISAINGGDSVAAEQVALEQLEAARTPEEEIRARGTLRYVRLMQGKTEEALKERLAAQACLDANPQLRTTNPRLVASLLFERAQNYESEGRTREAVALYDEARESGALPEHLAQTASFNAAVLVMRLGHHAEAVKRVDEYLASDVARGLKHIRVVSLRCQQVMWLAAGNDLAGAMARADEVLARYEGVDHPSLASVAVMRARYTPIGPGCAERRERIAAAQGMLSRLDHLNLDQFHATRGELHDMRQQLAVILRDTEAACPE